MSVVGVTYGTVGRLRHFTGSFWKPDEFHLLLSGGVKEEVSKGLSQRPKPSGVILGQGGGLGIISFPFGRLTDPFSLSRTSPASGLWKAEVAERVAWKGGSRQRVEAVARGAGDRGAASGSLGVPACDAASRGPGAGAGCLGVPWWPPRPSRWRSACAGARPAHRRPPLSARRTCTTSPTPASA